MRNPFTEHPAAAGQGYWQHCGFALTVSRVALGAAVAAGLHALFPFLFQRTAGTMLLALAERIAAARRPHSHETGMQPEPPHPPLA